jgi:hypothetical protein
LKIEVESYPNTCVIAVNDEGSRTTLALKDEDALELLHQLQTHLLENPPRHGGEIERIPDDLSAYPPPQRRRGFFSRLFRGE